MYTFAKKLAHFSAVFTQGLIIFSDKNNLKNNFFKLVHPNPICVENSEFTKLANNIKKDYCCLCYICSFISFFTNIDRGESLNIF